MTIHERIASLRRTAGLSQAALADLLDVSRQAIGKWESGASLPGLDNLQALAAALHVSCDELLTGQKPEAEQNASGEGGVSTAGVAALLEAERSARAQSEKRRTRALILMAAAFACVCAALIVCNALYSRRLAEMSERISRIQYQVSDINAGIDTRIGQLQNAIESGLNEQTNILASFDWQYGEITKDRTVPLTLTAASKTYTEGMTAAFSVVTQDGTVQDVPADAPADGVFRAETAIPLTDSYSDFTVFVRFSAGGETQTQRLFEEYAFVQQYLPDISITHPQLRATLWGDRLTVEGSYEVNISGGCGVHASSPVSAVIELLVDGESAAEKRETPDLAKDLGVPEQTELDQAASIAVGGSVTYHFILEKDDYPAATKRIELIATVTDAAGFTDTDTFVVYDREK